MLTARERRRSIAAGTFALGGIFLFAGLATLALLAAGWTNGGAPLFDPYLWGILKFTTLQAVFSALLSVALAIPFARALARQPDFSGRRWLVRLLALPLGLPVITGALGLLEVWGRNGWANQVLKAFGLSEPVSIYGLTGILLAHVFFNFPLAARLFLAGLERLPGEYWLLSSSLGFSSRDTFRHIEWPEMRRQIPAIAGLVLMLAATSFTLVLLLGGGPAATTFEVAIYQALRFDFDPPRAVSLALLQITVTGVLLVLLSLTAGGHAEASTVGMKARRPDGRTLAARAQDIVSICLGGLFLGLPLVAILSGGLKADLPRLLSEPVFLRALATSMAIALPAGLLSVSLATTISWSSQALAGEGKSDGAFRWRLAQIAPGAASLILLFPPTVLGTGWFLIAGPSRVDMIAYPLVVTINGLMALPFVLRIIAPAIGTHRHRTSRLASSLGIAGFNRVRLIDWPGLRRPLAMALSFATALSVGDLGAVALFGSDRFITLPWLLYSRMGSYRTMDAAGIALLLAILCLVLTLGGTLENDKVEGSGHDN